MLSYKCTVTQFVNKYLIKYLKKFKVLKYKFSQIKMYFLFGQLIFEKNDEVPEVSTERWHFDRLLF